MFEGAILSVRELVPVAVVGMVIVAACAAYGIHFDFRGLLIEPVQAATQVALTDIAKPDFNR